MDKKKRFNWGTYFEMGAMQFGITCGAGLAAGSYASGYFGKYGGGHMWLLLLLYTAITVITRAWNFEFGRVYKTYDYNSYFLELYGLRREGANPLLKGIVTVYFDVYSTFIMVLGLSSNVALFGTICNMLFGIPPFLGSVISIVLFAWLAIYGAAFMRKLNSAITLALIVSMGIVLFTVIFQRGDVLSQRLFSFEGVDWSGASLSAGYIAVLSLAASGFNGGTLVSYTQKIKTRTDAWMSGLAVGVMCFILFGISTITALPFFPEEVANASVVLKVCTEILGSKVFSALYWLICILAIVSTAPAIAFGSSIRFLPLWKGERVSEKTKMFVLTLVCGLIALAISTLGLMVIVSKGYALIGKIALPCTGIPLVIGMFRVMKKRRAEKTATAE